MKQIINYVWPVFLCLAIGYIASIFQVESMTAWYPTLVKSSLTLRVLYFLLYGLFFIF